MKPKRKRRMSRHDSSVLNFDGLEYGLLLRTTSDPMAI